MIDILLKSLPIFVTVLIGYVIKRKNFLSQDAVKTLSTVAYNISGPFYVFFVLGSIDIRSVNISIWIIPLVMFFLMFSISFLFFKLSKTDTKTLGVIILSTTLFGAGALYPYVERNFSKIVFQQFVVMDLLAFCIFLLFIPAGLKFLSRTEQDLKQGIKNAFKDPFLLSILFTFGLRIFNITIPVFLLDISSYIGGSFFFLITLLAGITFKLPDSKNISKVVAIYLFRLILAVSMVLALGVFIGADKKVLVSALLLYIAQVSLMAPVLANKNGFDDELATQLALFSITIQLVLYPVAIFIIQNWI